MKKILAIITLSTLLTGCTDADKAQVAAYGSRHKVGLYSGGQLVRTWTATGAVVNAHQSESYYFKDEATGKYVELSGTVVIEQF